MEDKTLANTPPPPPSEVKIRTMRSDIESMMQSGGGAPSFQNVAVKGLTLEKKYKAPAKFVTSPMPTTPVATAQASEPAPVVASTPVVAPAVVEPPAQAQASLPVAKIVPDERAPSEPPPESAVNENSSSSFIPVLIVTLVAILAVAVVGYFVYTLFIK